MVGSSFPYSEFLPRGGPGARRADRHRRAHARASAIRWRSTWSATAPTTLRALMPLLERKQRSLLARDDRGRASRSGGSCSRSARMAGRGSDQPAARLLRALAAAARPRDPDRRLRLVRELVRARRQAAPRHDGLAVGHPGDDGPGVPYAIAAKFAHPDRPVIALVGDGAMQMNGMAELITIAKYWRPVGRSAADRAGAQQPRSQPGHLGAAGDGGRSEVRRARSDLPDFPYARYAELIGLRRDPRRRPGRRRRGVGRGARAPTGRSCSRRSPTPRCRRCRRTSRSSRPRTSRLRRRKILRAAP